MNIGVLLCDRFGSYSQVPYPPSVELSAWSLEVDKVLLVEALYVIGIEIVVPRFAIALTDHFTDV